MKNLSRNDKIMLYVLCGFLIFFIYYEALLNPMMNKISDLKTKIKSQSETVAAIDNMEYSNKIITKRIGSLKDEYGKVKSSLPIEMRDPDIENDLSKLAQDNGVVLTGLNFGNEGEYSISSVNSSSGTQTSSIPSGKLLFVPVTLNVSGDYPSIVKYTTSIEKADRISEVKSINISSDSKSSTNINASLIVNFYYISGSKKDRENIKYNISSPGTEKDNLFK